MKAIEVEVRAESGLHARPAAALARAASGFSSTIRLENTTLGKPEVDARSVIGVLAAGVERGHWVRLWAEGPDEVEALAALEALLTAAPRIAPRAAPRKRVEKPE